MVRSRWDRRRTAVSIWLHHLNDRPTERIMGRIEIVLLTLLAAAGLQAPACADDFIEPRSWHFLNARGGIALEQPFREGGQWLLPVSCNVSGIKTINAKPTTRHSQLAWAETVAKVDGFSIYLTIHTARQSPDYPTAICDAAAINYLEPGVYDVFYLDPDGASLWLDFIKVEP